MPKIEYPCANCGDIRLRYPSQVRGLSFCSILCKGEYQSVHSRGIKNSNYKYGVHCSVSLCSCGGEKDYRAKTCGTCTGKIDRLFSDNTDRRNATLWRYIKTFQLLHWESCVLCGLGWEWNGMELRLHLDHINGNPRDNRIENLRVLCPNCHTQTPTYASKNRRVK